MERFASLWKALAVRFPLAAASLLAGLLLVCGVVAPALAASHDAHDGGGIGRVTRVQGMVQASLDGRVRPLKVQDQVFLGDELSTGPGARLEITARDNTVLTLGADTGFRLERYDLGRQKGAGAVLLRLTKGVFRAVTGRLEALHGGPFEVATPLGVIGIRGTDFWGGWMTPDELSVMLISGTGVYLVNEAGRTEIVNPGDGAVFTSRTAPPSAPSQWSPDWKAKAYRSVGFD